LKEYFSINSILHLAKKGGIKHFPNGKITKN